MDLLDIHSLNTLILIVPRMDSLEGKGIYLVETGFHGAKNFMSHAADGFARNMSEMQIESHSTQGSIFADDPALWEEIKKTYHSRVTLRFPMER
jgi:hypothetical protein